MFSQIEKYSKEIAKVATDFDIPRMVVATITLNESNCDPLVKPYRERTWRYFTDRQGTALNYHGSNALIQKRALELLGQEEFDFQIHAHGAFQTVGSVLRELGYSAETYTHDFYTQGFFAMKHLSKMRDRFVLRYRREPTNEQFYAMYNGGFGAVNEDGFEDYVADYIIKADKNERRTV